MVENVAPIQLGIRLLIPAGSRLLELDEVRDAVGHFDAAGLVYPWKHADPRMDALSERVQELADDGDRLKRSRTETFARIWRAAQSSPARARLRYRCRRIVRARDSALQRAVVLLRRADAGSIRLHRLREAPRRRRQPDTFV